MSEALEEDHTICASCGNKHTGMYCNRCGERVRLPRENTLLHYFQQVLNAFTFADTKLWRSLKMIVNSPGRYSSELMAGRRVHLMKPVNLFLLCNLVYFLFPVLDTFDTTLITQMKGLPSSEIFNVEIRVYQKLEKEAMTMEEFRPMYEQKSSSNSKLMLLLLIVFFSAGFTLFGFAKRSYYVEHLTFAFEYGIFTLFVNTILLGYLLLAVDITLRALGYQSVYLSEVYLSSIVASTSMYFLIRGIRYYYRLNWAFAIGFAIAVFFWAFASLQLYRWMLFEVTFRSM